MVHIRKTSNVIDIKRTGSKSSESETVQQPISPFASGPVNPLKSITERKSRGLTEEQRLALLQNALRPFATEARSHLPSDLSEFEKKMHKKMLEEGFPEVVANEAGDEVVDALLKTRRRVHRKQSA